jgi:hypothetical protein
MVQNDQRGLVYDVCYPNNIWREDLKRTRAELSQTSIYNPNSRSQTLTRKKKFFAHQFVSKKL